MSETAEIRKLFRDLIAPDLQALRAEVKNLSNLAVARHSELTALIGVGEARTNSKVDLFDTRTEAQLKLVNAKIDNLESRLVAQIKQSDSKIDL